MKKAIVLFSGGQDSTTCLLWAIKQFGKDAVTALSFDYGQKHAKELHCARRIAEELGITRIVRNVEGLTGSSALTDQKNMPNVGAMHPIATGLPASFTPGRNALFLTVAASIGYSLGIRDIVAGVCQTDYSGYPDCRMDFVRAQELALQLALGAAVDIHTPLMHLTKAETWKLAKQLSPAIAKQCNFSANAAFEIVRTQTLTDYNGDTTPNDWGMGREDNPASVLRAAGWREAKAHGWV